MLSGAMYVHRIFGRVMPTRQDRSGSTHKRAERTWVQGRLHVHLQWALVAAAATLIQRWTEQGKARIPHLWHQSSHGGSQRPQLRRYTRRAESEGCGRTWASWPSARHDQCLRRKRGTIGHTKVRKQIRLRVKWKLQRRKTTAVVAQQALTSRE